MGKMWEWTGPKWESNYSGEGISGKYVAVDRA